MKEKSASAIEDVFSNFNGGMLPKNTFYRKIAEAAIQDNSSKILDSLNILSSKKSLDHNAIYYIFITIKASKNNNHDIFLTLLNHSKFKDLRKNSFYFDSIFSCASKEIYALYVKKIITLIDEDGENEKAQYSTHSLSPMYRRIGKDKILLEKKEYDTLCNQIINWISANPNQFLYVNYGGNIIAPIVANATRGDELLEMILANTLTMCRAPKYPWIVKPHQAFFTALIKSTKDKVKKKNIIRKIVAIGNSNLTTAVMKTSVKLKKTMMMK